MECVPTGPETFVQFKAGKAATLMGIEVIEDVVNPNLSVGQQFVYVENFTHTFAGVAAKFSPALSAELHVLNGWDVTQDNNGRKSTGITIAVSGGIAVSITIARRVGPGLGRRAAVVRTSDQGQTRE